MTMARSRTARIGVSEASPSPGHEEVRSQREFGQPGPLEAQVRSRCAIPETNMQVRGVDGILPLPLTERLVKLTSSCERCAMPSSIVSTTLRTSRGVMAPPLRGSPTTLNDWWDRKGLSGLVSVA